MAFAPNRFNFDSICATLAGLKDLQDDNMEEEKKQESPFEDLFEKVEQHVETRLKFYSLTATEKISNLSAAFAGAMVIILFVLIILFFLSIGFAIWIGDLIHHRAGGFAIAALLFVPIGIAAYQWIRPFVRDRIIQTFLDEDDNDTEKQDKS